MKKIYIVMAALSSVACKQQQSKPLVQYNVKITQDELDIVGSRLVPSIKEDTVMAMNDTIAYKSGLIMYYAALKTEKMVAERGIQAVSVTKDLEVSDTLGVDIKTRLSI